MKTGFRIFGSRNNDKKGVYTTWIVLSWNGDLIYFMYTFMKSQKSKTEIDKITRQETLEVESSSQVKGIQVCKQEFNTD
jgi:hypothetical protein